MSYLGWYDPDPRRSARHKLDDAIARYRQRFDAEPEECLTNPTEAAALRAEPGELPLAIDARTYIARHVFYVGQASGGGAFVGTAIEGVL